MKIRLAKKIMKLAPTNDECIDYLLGKKLSYWKERHITFWACGDFLGHRDHRITKAISLTRKYK